MSFEELSVADAKKLEFATSDGPHSVGEAVVRGAIRQIAEIAVRYGLTPVEAAAYYIEDRELLADPAIRRSLRQVEAGNTTEITDEMLAEIKSRA